MFRQEREDAFLVIELGKLRNLEDQISRLEQEKQIYKKDYETIAEIAKNLDKANKKLQEEMKDQQAKTINE
jgi:hypothetical protein